jgi:hypothetical protein
MREVRNQRKGKQEAKTTKVERNRSEQTKARRVEGRKVNDFLTLTAQLKSSVKVAFLPRARRLISHFRNVFLSLNNKRVPMNCFLLLLFGLPLWPDLVLAPLSLLWA